VRAGLHVRMGIPWRDRQPRVSTPRAPSGISPAPPRPINMSHEGVLGISAMGWDTGERKRWPPAFRAGELGRAGQGTAGPGSGSRRLSQE
jgi:hypothetical protein